MLLQSNESCRASWMRHRSQQYGRTLATYWNRNTEILGWRVSLQQEARSRRKCNTAVSRQGQWISGALHMNPVQSSSMSLSTVYLCRLNPQEGNSEQVVAKRIVKTSIFMAVQRQAREKGSPRKRCDILALRNLAATIKRAAFGPQHRQASRGL